MKEQNTLIEKLNELKDQRRGQGKRHPLSMLILITIMASMSGYHGYRATEDFIKANRDELIAVFEPKKDRLPSFQTIRRALMAIDFNEFSLKFYNWASSRIEIKENEWFSMDGKAIRGTIEGAKYHEFTNLVSLFSSKNKKVLYAGKVDGSGNLALAKEDEAKATVPFNHFPSSKALQSVKLRFFQSFFGVFHFLFSCFVLKYF
jgi:hypothetical protein